MKKEKEKNLNLDTPLFPYMRMWVLSEISNKLRCREIKIVVVAVVDSVSGIQWMRLKASFFLAVGRRLKFHRLS